ncbi:hypothetical protein ABT294_20185 [Nonomuraea sp. NPDC000554]|uniref:WXG100-like domain-containing protein n=1 Tax=Nonomuraea sp. NPDC000554 TaxID=3154259 RepID=UPI003316BEBB
MWLDGIPIPSWARPWVGWAVGTDWPEGDERRLFLLADELCYAVRRIAAGVRGDGTAAGGAARHATSDWDGEALRAAVKHVAETTGGRKAELVKSLADLAFALNELGVQVQNTKRMIKLGALLLVLQIGWLLVLFLRTRSPWALFKAKARAQVTRMTVRQLRKRLLLNIALFGGLMAGMDWYVQVSQPRRERIDWGQVLTAAGTGALTGALLTGLAWLRPPRSMVGLMGESALANGAATLGMQVATGQPVDWTMVAKGVTSGAIGAADAHWASWSPGLRHGDPGGHIDSLLNWGDRKEVSREPLPVGGETVRAERIVYSDGTIEVEKEFANTDRRDREYFGAKLGRAMGAHVADVRVTGERTVRLSWVDGEPPPVVRGHDGTWSAPGYENTREGVLMGGFDTVGLNHDRAGAGPGHEGMRVAGGVLRGFDHDKLFGQGLLPDSRNPFVRHFFRAEGPGQFPRFVDNPLHPSDVAAMRPQVEAVIREMREFGHHDWADSATEAFRQIAEHAKGPMPILDAPSGVPLVLADQPHTTFAGLPEDASPPSRPPGQHVQPQDVYPVRSVADPDRRTAVVPLHDPAVLARLEGEHAYVLDPGRALHAEQWAHLRRYAQVGVVENRLHPHIDQAAPVEVRRMAVGPHRVTEVTVKVRFQAHPDLGPAAVERMKSKAMDGVDLVFNHQHRLSDGSQLHVRLEFQPVRPAGHGVVAFHPGHGRGGPLTWFAEAGPIKLAHEFGHLLGLGDEYPDAARAGHRTATDVDVFGDLSFMGGAASERWHSGGLVLDRAGHWVSPTAGLRDRHLARLERVLLGGEPPRVSRGAPGPRKAFDVYAPPSDIALPPHLRRLGERFPAGDRDPLEHARRLERVHDLFGRQRVTEAHLHYADALADAARSLYGTEPEALAHRDLLRLHGLAGLLGADPHTRPPDASWFRRQLGADLRPRDFDGLARLSEWFTETGGTRQPGETGAATLHRAAAEFLRESPDPATTRRAAEVFSDAAEQSRALAEGTVDLRALTAELRALQADGHPLTGADLAESADRPRVSERPPSEAAEHLVPGSGMRETLREGQRYAYSIDPRAAADAGSWADARLTATPIEVRGAYPDVVPIEARRMWARGPDGTLRPVTEFTVHVPYEPARGLSEADAVQLQADIRTAVDLYYNHQHRLSVDGSQLHVRVEFERAAPGVSPEQRIGLHPIDLAQHRGRMVFAAKVPLVEHAHRIGFLLGLEPDYAAHPGSVRKPVSDGVDGKLSVMGPVRQEWSWPHLKQRATVDETGRPLPVTAGLRDRHLDTLSGHLVRTSPSMPEVPLHRLERPAPVQTAVWPGSPDVNRHGLPKYVRMLLQADNLPQGERSFLDHVQLLDRATTVFFGSGPAGRLPFHNMTPRHLDYVETLVATGREVFGTGPEHPFSAKELLRLHVLAWQLGATAETRLPDAAWLRGQVNELLGRPADHVVTAEEVRFLGDLAGRTSRQGTLGARLPGAADAPATVRIALRPDPTPLEVTAARWGERAEAILRAAPEEPLVLRTSDRLREWLERVVAFDDPLTGVQARLGEVRTVGDSVEFTVRVGTDAGASAEVTHRIEPGRDGVVITQSAPLFDQGGTSLLDRQRVELAWRRQREALENAFIAIGAERVNDVPLVPPSSQADPG